MSSPFVFWKYLFCLFSDVITSPFFVSLGYLNGPGKRYIRCACVCSPGGEGLTAVAQTAWAENGSSSRSTMSQMPNWPGLIAKEIFLKTMMELLTSGQEMKNSGVRMNSSTPGGREVLLPTRDDFAIKQQ